MSMHRSTSLEPTTLPSTNCLTEHLMKVQCANRYITALPIPPPHPQHKKRETEVGVAQKNDLSSYSPTTHQYVMRKILIGVHSNATDSMIFTPLPFPGHTHSQALFFLTQKVLMLCHAVKFFHSSPNLPLSSPS